MDIVLALLLLLVVLIAVGLVGALIHHMRGQTGVYRFNVKPGSEFGKLLLETIVPVLYFGLTTYFGNGRTPGKRLTRTRVVSLVHDHMSLWHSIERALGYGAAALEFGFGFAQFFIHRSRRTVQDRIAETIVVKEESYRELFAKPLAARAGCSDTATTNRDTSLRVSTSVRCAELLLSGRVVRCRRNRTQLPAPVGHNHALRRQSDAVLERSPKRPELLALAKSENEPLPGFPCPRISGAGKAARCMAGGGMLAMEGLRRSGKITGRLRAALSPTSAV